MNAQVLIIMAGTLLMIGGYALHIYARSRFRTAGAPGIWPAVRPSLWRTRREWFSNDRGYRLSQRGGWLMSLGGLTTLVGSIL